MRVIAVVLAMGVLVLSVYLGIQYKRSMHTEEYVATTGVQNNSTNPSAKTAVEQQQDETIIEKTNVYELEVRIPNEHSAHSAQARTAAQDHVQRFIQEADAAYSDYQVDPAYEWHPYVLSIGYERYTTGVYTFFVLNEYYYTGGANGTQIVYTFAYNNGTGIVLGDVVPPAQRAVLLQLAQADLYAQNGITASDNHIFGDAINELTFDDLKYFYLTDTELVLLFDEYDVAPGALGAVRVRIPRSALSL